jgi:hypothetical protein
MKLLPEEQNFSISENTRHRIYFLPKCIIMIVTYYKIYLIINVIVVMLVSTEWKKKITSITITYCFHDLDSAETRDNQCISIF